VLYIVVIIILERRGLHGEGKSKKESSREKSCKEKSREEKEKINCFDWK
jgi:hypothetical protein